MKTRSTVSRAQPLQFGFNTDAIKRIARAKHAGEAQTDAADLLTYLEVTSGKEAGAKLPQGHSVLGSCVR